jgi:lipopolysaccharide cholinephosphotransferase
MKIRLSTYAKQSPISVDEQKRMELDILSFFHDFCQKNNLRYYAIGGTLLGAVRHKGFIPWDDDVDVMLPRSDYERFLQLFPQVDTGHYSLVSGKTNPDYPYNFAKIEDNRTILFEKSMSYSFSGIYIDVFPLDFLPENPERRQKLNRQLDFLYALVGAKVLRWVPRHSRLKTLGAALSRIFLSFIPVGVLRNKIDNLVSLSSKSPTSLVGILAIRKTIPTYCFDSAWMSEVVSLPFEHLSIRAPREYAKVLETAYGNYMQLPPVEERTYTHSTVSYFLQPWKDQP